MEQYIKKSALVAEIKRLLAFYSKEIEDNKENPWAMDIAKRDILQEILSFLETLEVKEVDLEKELVEEIYSHIDSIKDTADRMTSGNFMHNRAAIKFSANTIAKVLELIGLKAQKGE